MQKLLNLQELASRLKTVDTMIMELVLRRMELAEQVGDFKRQTGEPIFRSDVEDRRISEMREWAEKHGLNPHFAESLEYLLINESCKFQMVKLQGVNQEQSEIFDDDAWYELLKRNLLTLTERWSESYDSQYDKYFATRAHISFEQDMITKEIEKLSDHALMLDLGCASGKTALKFASYFDQVLGYDISQHMLAKASESAERIGFQEKARFEQCDLEDGIPVLDSEASFVVMNLGTASDVRDIKSVVEEVLRVLKPGGRFLFSFYNRNALMYRWDMIPWSTGLAASVNIHKDSLDVHSFNEDGVEEILSVYARAYTCEEVQKLFSSFSTDIEIATHPTLSSILPNELLGKQEVVQELVVSVDKKLGDSGLGAYIVVAGQKNS